MVKIELHGSNDWCHLCGSREGVTVDIWDIVVISDIDYLRICSDCIERMRQAAKEHTEQENPDDMDLG
jgi:ribosome-binding protein aMBF1 (putative translation factor)